MSTRLGQAVLLLHCGEAESINFCQRFNDELGLLGIPFRPVEVDCSNLHDTRAGAAETLSADALAYLRIFDVSVSEYDRLLAHPGPLESTPVPVTLFCVNSGSFRSRVFRNAFIHHTDAAGLRPGVHAVPVLFGTDYDDLKRGLTPEDHLLHSLRRAYLTLQASELPEIVSLVRALLAELPNDLLHWRKEKQRWLLGKGFVAVSFVSHQFGSLALIPLLVASLAALALGTQEVARITGYVAALIGAFLVGLRLADVPATPAFEEFRQDEHLRLEKALRHIRGLRLPGAVWAVVAVIYGTFVSHVAAGITGFLLGLAQNRWSYVVFQLRLRLAGAENFAEHMAQNILPILAEVAPSRVVPRLDFGAEVDWPTLWPTLWDLYAMRVMPSNSRPLLRHIPRVFISYAWQDEDQEFAFRLAAVLSGCGVEHFLDRRELRRGLPWRSRIALEISKASHFIRKRPI